MVNCLEATCPDDALPLILGGRDYSPPTLTNIARWQRNGHFDGQSFQAIQASYRERGYEWYQDELPCNCRCRNSQHAAFGGYCLEILLPATPEYEALHSGQQP